MSKINHNHILSLMQTGFTTIAVVFSEDPRNKKYTYKALERDNIQVGDTVVVESPNGLKLTTVVEVHGRPKIDLASPFPYKWIVQKVDLTAYRDTLKQEEVFNEALLEVERVRQREEILNSFHAHLPEGSEARKLFDTTMNNLVTHVS